MKILITSGGTKVPIDPVRDITNKSNGTFGSNIAKEALLAGHSVEFLYAKHSKTPFAINFNLADKPELEVRREVEPIYNLYQNVGNRYHETSYVTFDEYYQLLKSMCLHGTYDVIILAAAVSDYLVANYSNSKVKSKDNLQIELKHADKVISKVKDWAANTRLVGFKMLVGATDAELVEAAVKSIEANKCEFVVANDYKKLASGNHEVLIVRGANHYTKYTHGQAWYIIRTLEGLA